MLMAATEFMKRAFTKGPSNSLQSVLSVVDDYAFDRRHRLDTRSEVAINDLDISDEDKQHADKYKPTRARYFRKIMAKLNLPLEGVFVDVGCGKGRVLLLAAEHGFRPSRRLGNLARVVRDRQAERRDLPRKHAHCKLDQSRLHQHPRLRDEGQRNRLLFVFAL